VTISLSGSGFHHIHAESLGRDGLSTSPEATALFRVDCNAPPSPRLVRSRHRAPHRHVQRGDARFVAHGRRADHAPQLDPDLRCRGCDARAADGEPFLSSDGLVATLDLDGSASAWWRTKSVRFEVGPPAADVEGNEMLARFETILFLGAGPGDLSGSFLSGEVYDDESGRPLSVSMRSSSPPARPSGRQQLRRRTLRLDSVGCPWTLRIRRRHRRGRYALVLSRSGYTRVIRRLPLEPATGAVPFDSRLTQLVPAAGTLLTPSAAVINGPASSSLVLSADANAVAQAPASPCSSRLSRAGSPRAAPARYTPLATVNVRLSDSATRADVLSPFTAP